MTYVTDKDRGDYTSLSTSYGKERDLVSVSQNACSSNLASTTEEVEYEV